jgi:hypothetical protein
MNIKKMLQDLRLVLSNSNNRIEWTFWFRDEAFRISDQ